jgi:hypothetical protein
MATIQEQIAQARGAGYDDVAITKHLGTLPDYSSKVKTALDSGYKPTDILSYLENPTAPETRQNVAAEPANDRREMVQRELTTAIAPFAGAYTGVGNIVLGGQKLLGKSLTALGATDTGQFLTEDAIRRQELQKQFIQPYKDVAPGYAGTGEFIGEGIATLPVGSVLAKPIQAVGKAIPKIASVATPIVQSLKSGGFQTGLTPTTLAGKTGNVLARLVGGTTVGGTASALVDPEQTELGALAGGILPFAAPPAVKFIATGMGKFIDATTGKLANVKAGEIARQAAGDSINQIRAANGVAPIEDISAAQAAYGIDNDVYQAFLGFVSGKDTSSYYRILKDRQKTDQLNQLARLAGGSNETEIITNIGDAKRVLNKLTTPMRESALGKVDETGRLIPALTKEAEQLRQTAADKVADVRRFAGAQVRAIDPVQDNLATDYLLGKLTNSADEAAGKAAFESLTAGAGARTAEAKLAELQQAGIKPIYSTDIASKIENIANQPGVRADDIQRAALLKLRDKFVDLGSSSNGVMIGEDINQIRKTSINDAINKALSESGYDPKAQGQRLAGLLGDVRGYIDEAIRGAGGGKDWDAYLSTFSKGRQQLDQKVAAGQLIKILEKDPQKFVDIVKGKDPDFVEKIFGAGNKDIMQVMGGQRPKSPMLKLFNLADDVERDIKLAGQAKAGAKALGFEDESFAKKIPGFVGVKTAVLKQVIRAVEDKVNSKTVDILANAAKSGKSMNEILNTLPADDRIEVLKALKNASNLSGTRASVAGLTTPPPVNALAPEQQNQNALAR